MSTQEEVVIKLTLRGRAQAHTEVTATSAEIKKLGTETEAAGKRAKISTVGFGVLGNTFSFVEKWAKRAAVGVAGAAVAAGAYAFNQAKNSERIAAQTNAVIKSTGGVAGVSAGHVDALAGSIEAYGGSSRMALREAENSLLVFDKIRNFAGQGNDIFDQTTKVMVDMARARHQDLTTTANQIGKALQDPIKGLLMLRRAGVVLGPQEEKAIQNLAKTGHLLEAQKELLKDLNERFGGSEAAFGATGAGKIGRFKSLLQDLGAVAGSTFMPLINQPLGFINSQLDHLAHNAPGWTQSLQKFMTNFYAQIPNVVDAIRKNGNVGAAVDAMFGGSGRLTEPINKLVQVGKDLWHIWQDGVYPAFRNFAIVAAGISLVGLQGLIDVLHWLADHGKVVSIAVYTITTALIAHNTVAGINNGILLVQKARIAAVKDVTIVWTAVTWLQVGATDALLASMVALESLFGTTVAVIVAVITVVGLLAVGFVLLYQHVDWFHKAVDATWQGIQTGAHAVIGWFQKNWPKLALVLLGPFAPLAAMIIGNFDTIKSAFLTVINWIIDKWNWLADKTKFHVWGTDTDIGLPHIGNIGGGGDAPKGGVGGWAGAVGTGTMTVPKAHQGGTVTRGGLVNMRPGEELVRLPTAAQVVPLPTAPAGISSGEGRGEGWPDKIVLELDGKQIFAVTKKEANKKVARL